MKAFFASEQLLHQPLQFMRAGRICAPTDVPARATTLNEVLAAKGISSQVPPDYALNLPAVHSTPYLTFLKEGFQRWQALAQTGLQPGPEILPNMAPYYNGRTDQDQRAECPSPSIIAQASWYLGDLSCPVGPHTWTAALRSAHSAIAAAESVCASGGMAYALCRPSGHHAHRDRASGFCYLNNSAMAARRLRDTYASVALLDVDAHHGDGSQNIFYHRADVMTVSLHADPASYFPFYTGYPHEHGHGSGHGYNLNLPLPHGAGNNVFLDALDRALMSIRDFRPQALVLALGFDGYKDDPISVLRLELDVYRQLGERIGALGLPTVIVQEGGYMLDSIGQALDFFLQGVQHTPAE